MKKNYETEHMMDGTYIVAMLLGMSVCIIGVAIYSFSQDISVPQDRALIADDFLSTLR